MINNLYVVHHSFLSPKKSTTKRKKRSANCFLLFRQEMMKERPYKMKMSNYSKRVSEMWQNLSEDEKIEWKRRYELNRESVESNEP
ncbi:uncharacterized protein OCT59_012888 [Rhizophagus irregularis]|uniref:MATA-HMG n=2 Tax=Rhizophagus irregularis TaxID=588596 RepID=A0A1B1EUR7_9GLOM|nr:hypothetical protein GLOIN_2v1583112 [Rhizophagus irregularis DAOM 181602=DAOM 197198]ANQ32554.1 MATA-HMG [Rhizophagus irregularis]ANQ32555.1 MATA-HMG [Rhizophagus irregularis]ANQ32556.1 MATA-HMG [Rhizophagus irregularis]ANQ32557.1 MATA-HMG [Rhizophagus irregularis]ANQ32558.1 MATA-HMG [Rhizophagus irregularis]|eukprot:XP_025180564.1 hypothetical protein GLOIN_2v1583112 [Rhizophagus irregularis DAOM 181602=DAOM 197198]